MKKTLAILILTTLMGVNSVVFAQEAEEVSSPFSVGADVYSNYVWRGTKFGVGPAIQPFVEFSAGNFTLGSWGSFCFTSSEGAEADLYASYSFDFGLSIGITDYYYPGLMYFDYSKETGAHALELNLGYEISGLSLAGNYVLNEAGGAASAGGDMYFELGYSFTNIDLFVGGGDGWHTSDGEFNLCNVGIGTSKEIKVSDSFSLPVSGAVILNPDKEQFYVVVGFSL